MIIGSQKIHITSLTSSNTYASQLIRSGFPKEGTIIYTDYQTAGRGYRTNKWESENGKNLLFSIILFPTFIIPEEQFLISMSISLGLCDFLDKYIPHCKIKWPNDIYAGDDKIAGILNESSVLGDKIEYTVAGVGLNVNQEIFTGDAPNPVSMKNITGKIYDLHELLNEAAAALDKRYTMLREGNHGPLREEYNKRMYRLNELCRFVENEGTFLGCILGTSEEGRLVIRKESSDIKVYAFKEVEYII